MSLAPTTLFIGDDHRVPEGTSHRYVCTLTEEDGTAIQVGAIERHQITLRFTYNKVGGGAGQLTKRIRYDVESFERV